MKTFVLPVWFPSRARRAGIARRAALLLVALLWLAPAAHARGDSDSDSDSDRAARSCQSMERRLGRFEVRLAHRQARGRRARGLERRIDRLRDRYADHCVRLNQVQVIGTHNSYHLQPEPEFFDLLVSVDEQLSAWEYTHLPLERQFAEQGVRQIELDVFTDPEGGRYAQPFGLIVTAMDPNASLPALEAPGLKVLHVQDLDYRSTCPTLIACLETLRTWSDANPGHLPVFVLLELKEDSIDETAGLDFTDPLPFEAEDLDGLDAEIRSVFAPHRMITPDDVRGERATLREAVLLDGWPLLRDARGKIIFGMDNAGAKRALYRAGRPSLEGRVIFTNADPGDADAAFVKRNDPIGAADEIPELVAQGFLVRTRADSDTEQARTGDTTARDAALRSGAHFVSTDYPVPNPDFGSGYQVQLPGGAPGRCNPVNAPVGCRSEALERLD